MLTTSYLEKLREQYQSLHSDQRVTFDDIKQSMAEMEVDMEVDQT